MLTQKDPYGRSLFAVSPIWKGLMTMLTNYDYSLNKGKIYIARTVVTTNFFDNLFKVKYLSKGPINVAGVVHMRILNNNRCFQKTGNDVRSLWNNDYSVTNYEYGSYSSPHVPIQLDNIASRGNLYSSTKLFYWPYCYQYD